MSYGLPLQVRLHMLQQDMYQHARFIDYLLTVLKLEPGEAFTKKSIAEAVPIINEKRIREILNTELFCDVATEDDVKTYLFPSTIDERSKASRKPRVYIMLNARQFAEILQAMPYWEQPMWYTLPEACFASGKLYRAEVYHAFVHTFPGQRTRADLAEKLGVSMQTTRNLQEDARIIMRENYRALDVTWESDSLAKDGEKPSPNMHIQVGEVKYSATQKNAKMLTDTGVDWKLYMRLANSYDVDELA